MKSDFFQGKGTLVTGGARRLGREAALTLGKRGCRIAVHYNTSEDPALELCRELESMGVEALAVGGNLEDEGAVVALFEEAWEGLGGIDLLVNNASIFPTGRLGEMALSDLLTNIKINSWAPFLLTRFLWQRLRDTEGRASVVNLLDTRLVGGDLAHAPYHLSKSLLAELTTLMALEFAPQIQVNGVAPGAVLPPEEMDEGYLLELAQELPLKRRGYPGDIADAIAYLLEASFVTGQVIFVDGGRHIRLGGNT
jgi:NAD(P)-dependent dehydrogenase (short-subunit alcohol dehydrogenase family)